MTKGKHLLDLEKIPITLATLSQIEGCAVSMKGFRQ